MGIPLSLLVPAPMAGTDPAQRFVLDLCDLEGTTLSLLASEVGSCDRLRTELSYSACSQLPGQINSEGSVS